MRGAAIRSTWSRPLACRLYGDAKPKYTLYCSGASHSAGLKVSSNIGSRLLVASGFYIQYLALGTRQTRLACIPMVTWCKCTQCNACRSFGTRRSSCDARPLLLVLGWHVGWSNPGPPASTSRHSRWATGVLCMLVDVEYSAYHILAELYACCFHRLAGPEPSHYLQ